MSETHQAYRQTAADLQDEMAKELRRYVSETGWQEWNGDELVNVDEVRWLNEKLKWFTEAVIEEKSKALKDVTAERKRQIEVEGWTEKHDDQHDEEALAHAAISYCAGRLLPEWWPWEKEWWKPKNRRRNLVRAGALIIAAIEQVDRRAQDMTERAPRRTE